MLLSTVIKRSLSSALTLLCFNGTRECMALIRGLRLKFIRGLRFKVIVLGSTFQGNCTSNRKLSKPTAHHLPCGVNFADCVFSIAATLLGEECDILEAEAGRRDGDTSDICCARRV